MRDVLNFAAQVIKVKESTKVHLRGKTAVRTVNLSQQLHNYVDWLYKLGALSALYLHLNIANM